MKNAAMENLEKMPAAIENLEAHHQFPFFDIFFYIT